MKHIKPVNIFLEKYGMSQPDKEDSDEEKIWKYAESLYGNRCVNSQQKSELVHRVELIDGVYEPFNDERYKNRRDYELPNVWQFLTD